MTAIMHQAEQQQDQSCCKADAACCGRESSIPNGKAASTIYRVVDRSFVSMIAREIIPNNHNKG